MKLLLSQNAPIDTFALFALVVAASCAVLYAVYALYKLVRATSSTNKKLVTANNDLRERIEREDRLEEIREGMAQNVATLEAAAEPQCLNCKYFELDAAQQHIQNNKAFLAMTGIIAPWEYGRRPVYRDDVCPACKGEGNDPCLTCSGHRTVTTLVKYVYPEGNPPVHAKWSEHGWCTNEHLIFTNPNGSTVHFTERLMWGGRSNCDGKLYEIRPKRAQLRAV